MSIGQALFILVILTLVTGVTFASLVRNVIYAIRFSQNPEDVTYFKRHLDRTQDIAISFIVLFFAWLLVAGFTVGKYLIHTVYNG